MNKFYFVIYLLLLYKDMVSPSKTKNENWKKKKKIERRKLPPL